jgi:AraC-like DNA-binding protein
MPYRELPAPARSAAHVACVWMRDPEPGARVHRIVPDACVDIVWVRGDRLVVAGPATGPVLAPLPPGAEALGVRFRVGAAGGALGLPARELLDRTVALDELWGPAAAELAERMDAAPSHAAALAELTATVGRRLPADGLDALVRAAAVRAARRRTAVEALGSDLGVGERQLRRRFADAVGYGPKTLQRVLRFQRFLALARDQPGPPDLAQLAFEAGYADQAHLTRECGRLAGLPPAALLATGVGPAGERSESFKTTAAPPATMAA